MTARMRTAIGALIALVLAAGAALVAFAPAHAAVDVVAGTVTTPSGTPGIAVKLSQDLATPDGALFDSALGARTTTTDAGGDFAFSAVAPGVYYLLIDAGSSWVQHIEPIVVDGATDLAPVSVDLVPGVTITGTVRDVAYPTPSLAGIQVVAYSDDTGDGYVDWNSFTVDTAAGVAGALTGASGTYAIVVPLDETFQLSAQDPYLRYAFQYWDHRADGGCGCFYDPVDSGAPLSGPYDFDLYALDEWIHFSVLTLDATASSSQPGVLVLLDRKVGSTWSQVDSAVTSAGGYADLLASGAGVYRLRATIGGKAGVIVSFDDYGEGASLGAGATSLVYPSIAPGAGCGCDLRTVEADLALRQATGGGTPPAPRPPAAPPRVLALPAVDVRTATPTPTPTPSATPTPKPTSNPTSEPGPGPTPTSTSEPEPTAASGPLPWWSWLLIALLLLGIAVTIVVLVRRRGGVRS